MESIQEQDSPFSTPTHDGGARRPSVTSPTPPPTRIPFPHASGSHVKRGSLSFQINGAHSAPAPQDPEAVIAALREQLAKAQDDLRVARGQVATLDSPNVSSRSRATTPNPNPHRPPFGVSSPSVGTPPPPPAPYSLQRQKSRTALSMGGRSRRGSDTSDFSEGVSIRLVSSGAAVGPRSPGSVDGSASGSRIPVSAVSFGRVLAGDTSPRMKVTAEAADGERPAGEGEAVSPTEEAEESLGQQLALPRRRDREKRYHSNAYANTTSPVPMLPTSVSNPQFASSGAGVIEDPAISPTFSVNGSSDGPSSASSAGPPLPGAGAATAPTRSARGNPFFGSGGGRDRGAMIHQAAANGGAGGGGTGKVITNLQTDLLYARTALDQSKSQLRQNQRATESLTRQVEDLRESLNRLRGENEGLSKMLSRKERTVAELMDRVKKAEGEASTLRAEKRDLEGREKKVVREAEEGVREANRRRDRAESGYEAVRGGVKSMADGWRREVEALKKDMGALSERHRKELDENRLKYQTLAKLHASRSSALTSLQTTLNSLQASRDAFAADYENQLALLRADVARQGAQGRGAVDAAQEVVEECRRFKRMLRAHGRAGA